MRKSLTTFAIAMAIALAISATLQHVAAVSTNIVISQVYGGGGNSGAPVRNDFIELFNAGSTAVDVSTWSVQYAATTGSSWSKTNLTGVIPPGGYFLIAESSNAAVGAVLPGPDVTASPAITMAAGAGKVALVNNQTLIVSGTLCPTGASIVDFVGYGSGTNCFEGAGPTGTISATTAAFRAGGGCTDTDRNSIDFSVSAVSPRWSGTTPAPCGGGDAAPSVSSTTPASGATNVSFDSSIVINFSESVTASASAFSLACPSGSPLAFTQSASPGATITLTPTSPLPPGTTCAVKVTAAQVTDTDTNDPPDQMASDFSFSFTTVNPVDAAPFVATVTPASGMSDVPVNSTIVVTFSESVTASPAAFSVQCPVGVPQAFGQTASPATAFTLTFSSPLPYSTACTVSVSANQISDTDANDPPDGMASDVAFSFTTRPRRHRRGQSHDQRGRRRHARLRHGRVHRAVRRRRRQHAARRPGRRPLRRRTTPFTGNQVYAAFDLDG